MSVAFDVTRPLAGASFGATVRLAKPLSQGIPEGLPAVLADADGLMLIPGLQEIADKPELLVALSRAFGSEVEDYRYTLTQRSSVHTTVPEIFLVSNMAPVNRKPPRRPDPPVTADGKLPVQYPHRKGWHTDQSYRRPPPDISLFYAVTPVARDRGQTLFADGTAAYAALPAHLKAKVEGLQGLHCQPGTARSREGALAGRTDIEQAPTARSQPQPVVRVHPVTGRPALYVCEWGQMDWVDGPFVGMEPGPHGEGAVLLDELMAHYTRPEFVYAHEWTVGDLVVWDNRCLVHAATWYDGDTEQRMMWRTTVRGNPGAIYEGEARSWMPREQVPA
ncbi:MAG: TauD/TfdA family dioxygenase [Reyranella sp.]|nr:TauD/TfdA family dioxygenase [Reyranella sp.]